MLIRILFCILAVSPFALGFIFEDFASQTVFCECGPVPPGKQPACDVSTTCQHGTWTTVKQFDMMFGFCDCDLGWYGEFCELSSQIFEHPDLVSNHVSNIKSNKDSVQKKCKERFKILRQPPPSCTLSSTN